MPQPDCLKSTPVLFVESMAEALAFWRDRLGFAVATEVPGEDGPVFAILVRGAIELMLQGAASLAADPQANGLRWNGDRSFLFVEVADLDAVAAALDGCEVLVPRHETFYGAVEIA